MTEQETIRQAMKLLGARGGRVGGRSKSPAKMAAMELNLAKARAVRRERARTKTILHETAA
jgi:hypothetical protein